MQERINLLISQERWEDLIKIGSDAVDPLLYVLSKTLAEHRHENEVDSLTNKSSNHDPDYWKTFWESRHRQDIIINIISTLGKIQDIRAWNPLIDLSNSEQYEWPNQQIFEAISTIESSLQELKLKQNLYCGNCFHKFVKIPQISTLIRLLFHKSRHCNLTDEKQFIPILNSCTFSICRNCKGNKNYIENVKKVVLLLDDMDEPYSFENGILNVNWFKIKLPIDMNEIAIINCTNEDIAELVMKLRSDDEFERKKTFKRIPVSISKHCDLSLAKLNLLKNTFTNVQIVENKTINKSGG